MWLTGRLAPDFKTIADFRENNGPMIQTACARLVVVCVDLDMFKHAVAAIDGAKFKAVNSRDRNFTQGKLKRRMKQISESIRHYLEALDVADLQDGQGAEEKLARLTDKVAAMGARLAELQEIEKLVHEAPGQQISLTDPDSRAMATNMRGASTVGYNVQAAVDTEYHLIVAHEVTNTVVDSFGKTTNHEAVDQNSLGATQRKGSRCLRFESDLLQLILAKLQSPCTALSRSAFLCRDRLRQPGMLRDIATDTATQLTTETQSARSLHG